MQAGEMSGRGDFECRRGPMSYDSPKGITAVKNFVLFCVR